jgi:acyl-coenzyme A thioesterase PaaI-like protein
MASVADLPDVFRAYFAGLEEQRFTAGPESAFHHCFGCGPAHPRGLRVRCFTTDEGVASPIIIAAEHAGPPGAAHGGIVAAYLDEILGAAGVRATGRISVTGELTVRYVKPVPVAVPLLGRGRLVADHHRYIDLEGSLAVFETGIVVATARGRFFPLPQ